MKALDAIDRQLIALLQDDARTPTVALAKAVGLSRTSVQERLARLEQHGVIAQYTVRLGNDPQAMQAWLWLRYAEGFSCDDVLPLLKAMPSVLRADSLAGEVDVAVLVQVGSALELSEVREVIAGFKGVDDVTTMPVLRTLLERR